MNLSADLEDDEPEFVCANIHKKLDQRQTSTLVTFYAAIDPYLIPDLQHLVWSYLEYEYTFNTKQPALVVGSSKSQGRGEHFPNVGIRDLNVRVYMERLAPCLIIQWIGPVWPVIEYEAIEAIATLESCHVEVQLSKDLLTWPRDHTQRNYQITRDVIGPQLNAFAMDTFDRLRRKLVKYQSSSLDTHIVGDVTCACAFCVPLFGRNLERVYVRLFKDDELISWILEYFREELARKKQHDRAIVQRSLARQREHREWRNRKRKRKEEKLAIAAKRK